MTKALSLRSYTMMTAVIFMIIALVMPAIAGAQGRSDRENREEKINARVAERKEKAEERIEERRLTMETKSEERLQEACERRVEKLGKSMDRISTQATRLLGVMDSFHEKVEGFYARGQLTVSNYDALLADVDSAQEVATTEIAALAELNTDIDCTDPDVVVSVSSFKGSANAAKESLKEYRKSLVALISAMRSASAEDKGEAEAEAEEEAESEVEAETEENTEQPSQTETQGSDVPETGVEETN